VALDDRVHRELERAARPADPTGVYEDLIRRRERRRIMRRVEVAGLALLVVAGSSLGFIALSRVFGTRQQPAAGPSNGRLAFMDFESDLAIPEVTGGWYIFTMEPDGSDLTFVGPRAVDEALSPTFSPDGRRIAFAGFTADPEERALYVLDLEGGSLSKILVLDRLHQIDGLEWSPDGSQIGILYTEFVWTEPPPEAGARDSDAFSTIWSIAPDGTDHRQITTVGREQGFSWSPDGTQLVFSRHEPIALGDQEVANDLYVVNADGTGERRLTHDGNSMSPAWSPDGLLIAFESFGPDTGIDLYVMNADGSGRRRLTDDPGNETGAAWSPDGTLIAFDGRALMDDNSVDCFVSTIDVGSGDKTQLIGMSDVEGCPGSLSWAPAIETPTPSATPTVDASPTAGPTPSESPDSAGEDIGLGFRVCNVTSVTGEFAPGVTGTAYVATKLSDVGRCPDAGTGGAFQVVAVDVSGDGLADASYGPLDCDQFCSAFAAIDVNDGGTDDVLVQNVQFSIAGLKLFEVQPKEDGGAALGPVTVAPPGSAAFGHDGFEGDEEPQFWLGGDAGETDTIRCEPYEGGRALVSTVVSSPVDSPDPSRVIETWFVKRGYTLWVVDVREYTTNDDTGPFLSTSGCGVSLGYP
jgi:TolB protein